MTAYFSRGNDREFDVLVVSDASDDISPLVDSLETADATGHVQTLSNGDEALDRIHQRGEYEDDDRPDIILLDLSVPGTSGVEFLSEFDDRPELRRIPVLVLGPPDATADVARTYELDANAYLSKPATAAESVELADAIEDFWLGLARLPSK